MAGEKSLVRAALLNAQAGLLGAIPHAVGLDADKRIYAAYEPIAQRIAQSL